MRTLPLAVALILLVSPLWAQDARTIIERSVAANGSDWDATPDYDYFERDLEPDGGMKTYENLMLFGSPYQRLVAINGNSLSPEMKASEQQKLDAEIAKRRHESTQQRAQRIAAYQKNRRRNHLLVQQLTEAFSFTLIGTEKLDGFEVYKLSATPKPGYKPPNMETQVLKGMQGTLWIDTKTFQWVKVEAEVVQPVSIEGFVARVEPGTRFELEKMPVADDLWFPKQFSMKARAKVLFFFTHKSQEEETYFDYHKSNPAFAK